MHRLVAIPLLLLGGCSSWFFSGIPYPDRSRPVARIETRGGIEYGATTEFGVLFLGRTADSGPCRVRYFLGEQLVVDDGQIEEFGGVYRRARIDLRHQAARLWTEELRRSDPLVALVIEGGRAVEVPVALATAEGVEGDVLDPPARPLPVGTPLFIRHGDDEMMGFVGLISGEATLERPDAAAQRFLVFAGLGRIREALEVPENGLAPVRIKYRPDGVWVEQQDRRGAGVSRPEDG